VEQGKLSEDEFMNEIEIFIKTVVAENNTPNPEFFELLGKNNGENKSLGICPRCGAAVREHLKGYFCDTASCTFKIWKESKFWTVKKKSLTAATVTALLKDGRVFINELYSPKTGKTYDATVILT
jgi:DNA topoisomerase-3